MSAFGHLRAAATANSERPAAVVEASEGSQKSGDSPWNNVRSHMKSSAGGCASPGYVSNGEQRALSWRPQPTSRARNPQGEDLACRRPSHKSGLISVANRRSTRPSHRYVAGLGRPARPGSQFCNRFLLAPKRWLGYGFLIAEAEPIAFRN
jgi:hypothetical protein